MQAQWLIFAALLMAVGGALLLLLQARNGSREQRLIERRLGALANPGGSTRWLAGMTERMDDSFWVRRLQLMDSEARQLLQQAGWHESRYRTLYLISVFLTPRLPAGTGRLSRRAVAGPGEPGGSLPVRARRLFRRRPEGLQAGQAGVQPYRHPA